MLSTYRIHRQTELFKSITAEAKRSGVHATVEHEGFPCIGTADCTLHGVCGAQVLQLVAWRQKISWTFVGNVIRHQYL